MEIENRSGLPVNRRAEHLMSFAAVVGILMTGLSIIGLGFANRLYPTEEFIQSFMTNDIINLIVGAPVLIATILLVRSGKITGLLLLPGSMLYVIYNSLAYVFGRPFDLYSVGHLVLVLICAYGIFYVLSSLAHEEIHDKLFAAIPAKFSGWVLTGFGVLFFFRAVGMFASSLVQSTAIPVSEVGVLVADMILSVLLVAGGVMLLRKKDMGTAVGLGLLYATSMLFVGLIVLLIIQAVMNGSGFPVVDILVVALMGTVCFIPFIRYLRVCANWG